MGYKIQYEIGGSDKICFPSKRADLKKRIIMVLVCVFVLSMLIAPVRIRILQFFIPGDTKVTTSAFSQMISDLKNGDSLKSAVSAFCETVIQNG